MLRSARARARACGLTGGCARVQVLIALTFADKYLAAPGRSAAQLEQKRRDVNTRLAMRCVGGVRGVEC